MNKPLKQQSPLGGPGCQLFGNEMSNVRKFYCQWPKMPKHDFTRLTCGWCRLGLLARAAASSSDPYQTIIQSAARRGCLPESPQLGLGLGLGLVRVSLGV